MSTAIDASTPVLVGWGVASQRFENPLEALEPLELMKRAVVHALAKSGCASLGPVIDRVYVPKGRWSYTNPGEPLARAAGAVSATSVLATVGVLQQTLIGDACLRIRDGEARAALVVGGDCGYRLRQAGRERLPEAVQTSEPDIVLAPDAELVHPAEKRVGLDMPVGNYALIHSAYAARRGMSPEALGTHAARLFSELSAVARRNPQAWDRKHWSAEAIASPGAGNRMQAYPYTRMLCSDWSVDQAGALLFCSAGTAQALGIPEGRWIFPLASAESNHMTQVLTREDLAACPGARIAGRAALAATGLGIEEIDLLELYSCFPAAVELYAHELGVRGGRELTVTGGMPFAGGPYNNYVIQASCRMAELLAAARRTSGRVSGGAFGGTASDPSIEESRDIRHGLVSSVSGRMTKQGFGVWSSVPGRGFESCDVTEVVAREMRTLPVSMDYAGSARVAGCTVLYERGAPARAVVIADAPGALRVAAQNFGEAAIAAAQAGLVGAEVRIREGQFFELA